MNKHRLISITLASVLLTCCTAKEKNRIDNSVADTTKTDSLSSQQLSIEGNKETFEYVSFEKFSPEFPRIELPVLSGSTMQSDPIGGVLVDSKYNYGKGAENGFAFYIWYRFREGRLSVENGVIKNNQGNQWKSYAPGDSTTINGVSIQKLNVDDGTIWYGLDVNGTDLIVRPFENLPSNRVPLLEKSIYGVRMRE